MCFGKEIANCWPLAAAPIRLNRSIRSPGQRFSHASSAVALNGLVTPMPELAAPEQGRGYTWLTRLGSRAIGALLRRAHRAAGGGDRRAERGQEGVLAEAKGEGFDVKILKETSSSGSRTGRARRARDAARFYMGTGDSRAETWQTLPDRRRLTGRFCQA